MGTSEIQDAVLHDGDAPGAPAPVGAQSIVTRGLNEVPFPIEYHASVSAGLHEHNLVVQPEVSIKSNGRSYPINPIWPSPSMAIELNSWCIDEHHAGFLTSLVKVVQPQCTFETGTHRGRATQAIVDGMDATQGGDLWTVDLQDWGYAPSPQKATVHKILGEIPEVFSKLKDIPPIELAVLDACHDEAGLLAELSFVEGNRAKQCWVVVDNTNDPGWPELQAFFETYRDHPCMPLPTLNGAHLIYMSG